MAKKQQPESLLAENGLPKFILILLSAGKKRTKELVPYLKGFSPRSIRFALEKLQAAGFVRKTRSLYTDQRKNYWVLAYEGWDFLLKSEKGEV